MGVLSYAALGAVGGAGKGLADVGSEQAQLAMMDARLRQQAQMRQDDIAARNDRIDARQFEREDWRDGRDAVGGVGGRGSGGGRGGSSGPGALEMATSPEYLSQVGGMDHDKAVDAISIGDGKMPMRDLPGPPDESGNGPGSVAKYDPGSAADLVKQKTAALYQAMKLSNPAQSDVLSKSQTEDRARGLSEDYLAGNERAGSAALNMRGHATSGASGNLVTGAVEPGTVASATVNEKRAAAGEHSAIAGEHLAKTGVIKDERDGKVSIKAQLATLDAQRKQLANDRADVKAQESALKGQFGDDVDSTRKQLSARRTSLDARADQLDADIKDLTKRATVVDDGTPKGKGALARAGGGSASPVGESPASIKAAFQAGKLTREQAKAKLAAFGYQ